MVKSVKAAYVYYSWEDGSLDRELVPIGPSLSFLRRAASIMLSLVPVHLHFAGRLFSSYASVLKCAGLTLDVPATRMLAAAFESLSMKCLLLLLLR